MSNIQTPEEFERWWCSVNGTSLAAAIASRDAQIRAEAAEVLKGQIRAEIDGLLAYQSVDCGDFSQGWRGSLEALKRIPSLQPAKPPRDPRALELAEDLLKQQSACVDARDVPLAFAALLAANVREWREK